MKKVILVVLFWIISSMMALAEKPTDLSQLPSAVRQTINEGKGQGEVKSVKTVRREGVTVYEVEYKGTEGRNKLLVGQDGAIVDDEQGPGKGTGRGKGKAKGHYKNGRGDRDNDSQEAEETVTHPKPTVATSAPATTPAVTPTPAPATPQAQKPQVQAHNNPSVSVTEVKAQLKAHVARINTLGNNPKLTQVGLVAISKETGVPVSGLQAQLESYKVGHSGLYLANAMSKATGKPARTFLQQRKQSREWDQIAADNKFDLATVLPNLERIEQTMEAAQAKSKRAA